MNLLLGRGYYIFSVRLWQRQPKGGTADSGPEAVIAWARRMAA